MNTINNDATQITNFISENINLLTPEELQRLFNRQKLLNNKKYQSLLSGNMDSDDQYESLENQQEVNELLYNLVENFKHDQKEYNELLFDLVFGLMAAKETSDRDEWYRIRIMLLYKVMTDLGQCLFPNSYINKPVPAKLKAI